MANKIRNACHSSLAFCNNLIAVCVCSRLGGELSRGLSGRLSRLGPSGFELSRLDSTHWVPVARLEEHPGWWIMLSSRSPSVAAG